MYQEEYKSRRNLKTKTCLRALAEFETYNRLQKYRPLDHFHFSDDNYRKGFRTLKLVSVCLEANSGSKLEVDQLCFVEVHFQLASISRGKNNKMDQFFF